MYPKNILKHFQDGGFVVSIRGRQWHYVALDEAHEMCINKDLKGAVVHPTKANLQKTSLFFSYCIQAQKNLRNQLFPEMNIAPVNFPDADIFTTEPKIVKKDENVSAVMSDIEATQFLPANVTNQHLHREKGYTRANT